jgi:hypothetical protein
MNIVPEKISQNFKFFHDQRPGDFEQFHLYLYYKNGIHTGTIDAQFQHTWKISGTLYDSSSDQTSLVKRRREEEEAKFLVEIKKQLILERKRLVINEEGICKGDG